MKEYNFYGWQTAEANPIAAEFAGISSPRELYDILSGVWSVQTCAPRFRPQWSESNKTLGQCSITAFLVQDIFGGDVLGTTVPGAGVHCYNSLPGCVFDLTSEQFGGRPVAYSQSDAVQQREVQFADEEKKTRYEYLRSAVLSFLAQRK